VPATTHADEGAGEGDDEERLPLRAAPSDRNHPCLAPGQTPLVRLSRTTGACLGMRTARSDWNGATRPGTGALV